ncbi:MAG: CvpA family protein [Candidatus Omnitrophica bacterium]|nr:CvpA family protein [Candidatus Omnitrophota bacterium]
MLLSLIKHFNWVDCFIIILVIRICYVSLKRGFIVEAFKLLGTILAIYLSLHYYSFLADYLNDRFSITVIPLEFLDFLCFALLAIVGYSVFIIFREGITRLIKSEAAPQLNKWGGLVIGGMRAFLLASLLVYMLLISTLTYLNTSVHRAYFGTSIFRIAPGVYSNLWNTLMSKFMVKEKFNNSVTQTEGSFQA